MNAVRLRHGRNEFEFKQLPRRLPVRHQPVESTGEAGIMAVDQQPHGG